MYGSTLAFVNYKPRCSARCCCSQVRTGTQVESYLITKHHNLELVYQIHAPQNSLHGLGLCLQAVRSDRPRPLSGERAAGGIKLHRAAPSYP